MQPTRTSLRSAALLATLALAACGGGDNAGGGKAGGDTTQTTPPAAGDSTATVAFRNSTTGVDSGWTGPVFQLSHAYPDTFTTCSAAQCPWLSIPIDTSNASYAAWAPYVDALLLYAAQGQTNDLNNNDGWNISVGGKTRWFHVPWMAYDPIHGREFIHGTTNERTSTIHAFRNARGELLLTAAPVVKIGVSSLPGASGDTLFETWSVGMYNEPGAYAIGKAVPAAGVPQVGGTNGLALPARFPRGSMVVKLLFSTASAREVAYLRNSPEWTVDRHVEQADTFIVTERTPGPVHLVQMDIAVRDDRSPIGWVYATFAYNGNRAGARWWERMAPVGVQWGSDPLSWPAVDSAQSKPLTQSAINRNVGIPQHLGCAGRLAGPVDNPASSCTSCHGGAYAPSPVGTKSTSSNSVPIFGFAGQCATVSPQNTAYFGNVAYPNAYPAWPGVSGPSINLDTSLQLQVAYVQYANFLGANGNPTPTP